MEAAATLCLLLRSKAEYSGSSSGTSLLLPLDLRSGPRVGRGGGRGTAPRSAGGRWAAEAASRNSTQSPPLFSSTHDFFAEKRGEVGGFCICFLFSFSAICQVLQPPTRAAQQTAPPPAPGSRRWSPRGGRPP